MFEIREIKHKAEYNPLLISKQAPFTQAWFYGEWQEMMGRKVRRFEVKKDSEIIGFFQIISYPLPFNQNLLYIPHAPLLRQLADSEGQAEFLEEFHRKLSEIGKEENAIFARFDLYLPSRSLGEGGLTINKYFKKVPGYAYNSVYFQPKFEWILDLSKTEEELLKAMRPKTRYNIGLAERKGIKVNIVSGNFNDYFGDFHRLMEDTARRDDFNLHPKNYYRNIFTTLNPYNAFLTIAEYNGKILAINLVLLFGNTAYFLFGGSSDEYKNLMFSHLAQWEAIKEAKKRDFEIYNFGGVDAEGIYEIFGGVSIFKKRFGGKLREYSDSYDLVLKPLWYRLYNIRKKLQSHQ